MKSLEQEQEASPQGDATRGATERALQAAVAIYARWEAEREQTPMDRVVAAEFRSRRYLNAGERRWISSVVYGCVRYLRRQEWLLERLGLPMTAANTVRLWADAPAGADEWSGGQGAAERSSEEEEVGSEVGAAANAAPDEAPPPVDPGEEPDRTKEGGRGLRTPPTADPESIRLAVAALPGGDRPEEALRITLSFPDPLARELLDLLGAEAVQAAAVLNRQAPVTLRVNPLRVGRDHLLRALPEATPTRCSPWGLELPRRVNVHDLPGYRTGWFEVQEEASQLAALLVDALPGETVVEVGAGAGGKTLALAALMDNRGRLVAIDTSEPRLEELKKRAERAGAACIETLLVSADADGVWQPTDAPRRILNRLWGQADRVLIDAPCTGSGVLRRSPDGKWREMDLDALQRLQDTLLAQAAQLTAPGGHLIYVTCAFERSQDEAVIERFLETQMGRQFVLEPAAPRLAAACERAAQLALLPLALRGPKARKRSAPAQEEGGDEETAPTPAAARSAAASEAALSELTSGPFLRTWPHRHGLDAFFAACLRRERQNA